MTVKERPILFTGEAVQATLAGLKTQFRRAINPEPSIDDAGNLCWDGINFGQDMAGRPNWSTLESQLPRGRTGRVHCPFGKVGDRLWVRESFADLRGTGIEHRPDPSGPIKRFAFAADTPAGSSADAARKDYGVKWRPSVHMPREACRLILEITGVRVERLQLISETDALAEGIKELNGRFTHNGGLTESRTPAAAFARQWDDAGGTWVSNPWVWVVEYKRVEPPHG